MKQIIVALLALAALGFAADKKDWKPGHIIDAQIQETGGYVAIGAAAVPLRNQVVTLAGDFLYTVDRIHAGSSATIISRCRFIAGSDVRYRQEKQKLWIIDADGKECQGEITRQEQQSANSASSESRPRATEADIVEALVTAATKHPDLKAYDTQMNALMQMFKAGNVSIDDYIEGIYTMAKFGHFALPVPPPALR
jgi:hypothetical protein